MPEPRSEQVVDIDGEEVLLDADSTVIWQGFFHEWTHNHRWNRFGHGVRLQDGLWQRFHAAASGSSPDEAEVVGEAAVVTTPSLAVQVLEVETLERVYDGETETWRSIDLTGTLALPREDQDRLVRRLRGETPVAWLNGFDLAATDGGNAGKPVMFALSLDDVRAEGGDLFVDYTLSLALDCTTPECILFVDPAVDVTYRVWFGVSLGWSEGGAPVHQDVEVAYDWDAPPGIPSLGLGLGTNEDAVPVEPFDIPIPSPSSFWAIDALSLQLSHWNEAATTDEQHMLGWSSRITGDAAELMFSNWDERIDDHPLSYPEVGRAEMALRLVSPDPGDLQLVDWPWALTHAWTDIGAPADGPAAESTLSARPAP